MKKCMGEAENEHDVSIKDDINGKWNWADTFTAANWHGVVAAFTFPVGNNSNSKSR